MSRFILTFLVGTLILTAASAIAQTVTGETGGNRTFPGTGSAVDATPPKEHNRIVRDPNTGEALNPARSSIIDGSRNNPDISGNAADTTVVDAGNVTERDCLNLSARENSMSRQDFSAMERACIEQNLGTMTRTPGDTSTSTSMRGDTRFGTNGSAGTEPPVNRSITGRPHTGDPRSITGR